MVITLFKTPLDGTSSSLKQLSGISIYRLLLVASRKTILNFKKSFSNEN